MTTQPTPQQNTAAYISGFEDGKRVTAAELRRLHEVEQVHNTLLAKVYADNTQQRITALEALNAELLVALKDIATTCSTAVGAGQYLTLSAIEKAARAAIAKAGGRA